MGFVQLLYAWRRTTQQSCIKKFCQNICSEITIKTFHFSHLKVNGKFMNISAKFQLHPPYGFWGDDFWMFFFLQIYPFGCHGNQSNSKVWTKFIRLEEDYSRNISVKLLSKYLQWDSNKGLLSLFPLQVNGNLSCHSNESTSPDPSSIGLDFFVLDVHLTKWENRIEQNRHQNIGGVTKAHVQRL